MFFLILCLTHASIWRHKVQKGASAKEWNQNVKRGRDGEIDHQKTVKGTFRRGV